MSFEKGIRYAVFSIRKVKNGSNWVRAGSAWVNRDGSMNLYLDVLPLDGTLHVRREGSSAALTGEDAPVSSAADVPDRPSSGDFNDDGTFKDQK